jgi:hypothetical protein
LQEINQTFSDFSQLVGKLTPQKTDFFLLSTP